MTKKETDMFDNVMTIIKQNMEVQKEILAMLQQLNAPIIRVQDIKDISNEPGPVTLSNAPTPEVVPPAPAPVIPPPKEYTIEDCRAILGAMVEKLGEEAAWAYLKTFKVEMLPDLEPARYAELVQGAEQALA